MISGPGAGARFAVRVNPLWPLAATHLVDMSSIVSTYAYPARFLVRSRVEADDPQAPSVRLPSSTVGNKSIGEDAEFSA